MPDLDGVFSRWEMFKVRFCLNLTWLYDNERKRTQNVQPKNLNLQGTAKAIQMTFIYIYLQHWVSWQIPPM